MINNTLQLPEGITNFVKLRLEKGGVSAVLLYGSYARGTQHEQSDVDIIFIVDEGFKREITTHAGLLFEVLEQTKNNLYSFWQKTLDIDRHWYLWKDIKILYDRDGAGKDIIEHALSLVGEKQPWSRPQIENERQKMLGRLPRIRYLARTDPGTASILLIEFVRAITENWFAIHGRYIPSSKVLLAEYKEVCPEFGMLLTDFYLNSSELDERFVMVERMLEVVYIQTAAR